VAIVWFALTRLGGVGDSPRTAASGNGPALSTAEPTTAPATTAPSPTSVDAGGGFAIPADARPAVVRWIHDGDSFDVRFIDITEDASADANTEPKEYDEVRLQGLDTPEPGACFANEARDSLIELLKGQKVMVHADWDGGRFSDGRDQYFRLIANVWLGDRLINVDQVARGYATARSSDGEFDQAIAAAQRQARDLGLGLWSQEACGGLAIGSEQGSGQLSIAQIRADADGRDDENPNDEWIEIANTGDTPVELSDWSVRDESTRNRYEFPAGFVLDAQATVRVRSGCGVDTKAELFWCAATPVWTNAADTAYLVQPDGRFHDVLSYPE